MSDEPRLYARGKRGIWWADLGDIGGIRHRYSTHETDRRKALRVALRIREELASHRANAKIKLLTRERPSSEWELELASPAGELVCDRLLKNSRSRAKQAGLIWALSDEDFQQLMLDSGGRCAVTGLRLSLDGTPRAPFKPSIDRVDNALGYSYGNCRVTLMAVNVAMNVWGESTFRSIAMAFSARQLEVMARNPAQQISRTENIT